MGYLIDNNQGETSFFDPSYSNLSANVTNMTSAASGFYYLFPAVYQNYARLLFYSFTAVLTTTSTGNFSFTVNLPNLFSGSGFPVFIPFTCSAYNTNFDVLHLNANLNLNPNKLDCVVHSANTITGNSVNFTVQLFVNI